MKKIHKNGLPTTTDVLKVHGMYEKIPHTFPEVLGDGFLYHSSPVFRNIRETLLNLGYQIKVDPPFPYFALPLLSLTEIIQTKIVPIMDNVSFVKIIENETPGFYKLFELDGLHSNYVLHESSHCVAHHILGGPPARGWTNKKSTEKIDIIKIMLGESFANSSELIFCNLLKKTPLFSWLLPKNIYFNERVKDFNHLVDTVGLPRTAKMTILLFLYSNFLAVKIGPTIDKKIFEFVGLDKKITKDKVFLKNYADLKALAFKLNPSFRVFSTKLYLKRVGIKTNLTRLLNFDPLRFMAGSAELRSGLDDLAAVIDGSFIAQSKKENLFKKVA